MSTQQKSTLVHTGLKSIGIHPVDKKEMNLARSDAGLQILVIVKYTLKTDIGAMHDAQALQKIDKSMKDWFRLFQKL